MSGAMQRETEKAEEIDLEQKPKTTTIDDRLIVISYPRALDAATCRRIEESLRDRLMDHGLTAVVVDGGAQAYRPSAIGAVSLQLSSLDEKVAALAEMVARLVEFVEAGEDPTPEERTLDGDLVGGPRDQTRSL